MPTSNANELLISTVFEKLNHHDVEALAPLVADNVTEEWPIVGHVEGRAAVVEHFRTLFAALPDLRIETLRMASKDDTVFVHWHATGTFSGGPFAGILATGRSIDLRGTDCITIADSKIIANVVVFDGMAFATQAGVLPQHGTVADRMMTSAVNAVTRVRGLLRTETGAKSVVRHGA